MSNFYRVTYNLNPSHIYIYIYIYIEKFQPMMIAPNDITNNWAFSTYFYLRLLRNVDRSINFLQVFATVELKKGN